MTDYLTLSAVVFLAGSADEATRNRYHAYLNALGVKPGERPSREVGDTRILGRETWTIPKEDWRQVKVEVYSICCGRLHSATVTAYCGPYDEWDPSETVVERAEAERAGVWLCDREGRS